MAGENIRLLRRIRVERPVAEIVRTTKHNSVGAREHVEAIEDRRVLHLRLGAEEMSAARVWAAALHREIGRERRGRCS